MDELRNFIYELRGFAQQSHDLKDAYDMLTEEQKQMIMDLSPGDRLSPEQLFQEAFQWFETVEQAELIPDDQ